MENEVQNKAPVLIDGPSLILTPDELAGRQRIAVHRCSSRDCGAYVNVPCLELPASLYVHIPQDADERIISAIRALRIPPAIYVYNSLDGLVYKCPLCGSPLSLLPLGTKMARGYGGEQAKIEADRVAEAKAEAKKKTEKSDKAEKTGEVK